MSLKVITTHLEAIGQQYTDGTQGDPDAIRVQFGIEAFPCILISSNGVDVIIRIITGYSQSEQLDSLLKSNFTQMEPESDAEPITLAYSVHDRCLALDAIKEALELARQFVPVP